MYIWCARTYVYTGIGAYTGAAYRHIGAWGRRYGCARAFSQPQGTNHYFIFHFVYFNSGGDANPNDLGLEEGGIADKEKEKTKGREGGGKKNTGREKRMVAKSL